MYRSASSCAAATGTDRSSRASMTTTSRVGPSASRAVRLPSMLPAVRDVLSTAITTRSSIHASDSGTRYGSADGPELEAVATQTSAAGWVSFASVSRLRCCRSRGAGCVMVLPLPRSVVGCGDGVGLDRVSGAERLGPPDGAVLRGLLLGLGVDLRAEEHDEGGQEEPEQEHHHAGQRAVGPVVGSEVADVDGEAGGAEDPQQGGHGGAEGDPGEAGVVAVRGEPVEHGQPADDEDDQPGPAQHADHGPAGAAEADLVEHDGQHG